MIPKYRLRMCVLVLAIVVSMIAVAMTPVIASAKSDIADKAESIISAEPAFSEGSGTDPRNGTFESQGPDYVTGEIIVRFKQGVTASGKDGSAATGIPSVDELNKRFEVKGAEKLLSGSHKLKIRENADVQYAASQYERNPNVEYAEPNFLYHTLATPNDPMYSQQWAHELTQAPLAWDLTTGSPSVVIALIDSGVDWNHPDLAANIWANSDEIPGNGVDDDHNKYVDDVRGWDFLNNDNDPMDDMFHGTHCAGIIAGVGNNMIGVAGITWSCKIMALKAGNAEGLPSSAIANALRYAADNGAKIVSMSFGGHSPSSEQYAAIQYAQKKGLLLVAAAGNDGASIISYPSYYSEVVAVSATDAADNPAFFTTFGSWVDVSAPGLSIHSTLLNDTYASCSGTSMACPYVAGLSALIWSRFPTLSRDLVRSQLQNTTDDLGDPGFDVYYGWGRVNARWAVDHTSPTHDLKLRGMNAPHVLKPGTPANVNARVLNFGQSGETLVAVNFYVNGVLKETKTIAAIPKQGWSAVTFSWTPTSEGWYDLKTDITPKTGDPTGNNAVTSRVLVRSLETLAVPTDFRLLQQGISYAGVGYTVRVAPGSYYGQFVVPKSVTFAGENRDSTIIDGMVQLQPAIWLWGENTTISGFTIKNCTYGIFPYFVKNITVADNKFANCEYGVYVRSNSKVMNNILEDCTVGIEVWGSRCSITGNTLTTTTDVLASWTGIRMYSCGYSSISNNTIRNLSGAGISFMSGTYDWPPTYTELIHCVVADNTLDGLSEGMYITGSDNVIRGNQMSNCSFYSIALGYDDSYAANRVIVRDNTITNSRYGVLAHNGVYNTITGNNISHCSEYCLYFGDGSFSTSIVENTLVDSAVGIFVARFSGSPNTIHHNNLIGNTQQITQWGSSNVWDDGLGHGNFWSDYNGTDTDGDGVGETNLPWQGVDSYPWMLPVHTWGSVRNIESGLMYDTIQEAIDAIQTVNGHTIVVEAGTYSGPATLTKSLKMLGERGGTVIDGKGTQGFNLAVGGSTISGFTIHNCSVGVYVWPDSNGNTNGNTIDNNTISDMDYGVYLLGTDGNLVCDNTITGGSYGVALSRASNNTPENNVFKRNVISGNTNGILLLPCSSNTFAENMIQGNSYGAYILPSGTNRFYHNNFVNNADSVYSTTTITNVWDDGYPSGGNYWSDYGGPDANHDGIGDTPYVVDSHSQDRYPLMEPWDSRVHDVAVTSVVAAPTTVMVGGIVTITVTVANQGNYTETFSVTAYYYDTPIGTRVVSNLAPNTQVVLSYAWNTAGLEYGYYNIKAIATQVPGETDTADNAMTGGTVTLLQEAKMHVQSISFATSTAGKTQKLLVTVKIVDKNGQPVSSATAYGTLTLPGGTTKTYSGATLAAGTITFEYSVRNSLLPKGTYSFTVTNVTHATFVYNPSENVETTDSYTVV